MAIVITDQRKTVADMMSTPVVTVRDTDSFKHVIEVLQEARISGVPVVAADGTLLGIVSESDLMLKQEGEIPGQVTHPVRHHRQQVKAQKIFAGDLMTSPVVSVTPETALTAAARRMEKEAVKRLVVVDAAGALVGIITRGDVLKVFLRTDAEIREEVIGYVIQKEMMIDTAGLEVTVKDGVVTLTGEVDRRSDIERLVLLTYEVDGVVSVTETLSYRMDDMAMDRYIGAYGRVGGLR